MPNRVLARHPVSLAGVVLTTVSAVGFIALLIALLFGLFNNPHAALVVFVALPALFVLGLLLIPFGMWLEHRTGAAPRRDAGVVRHRFQVADDAPQSRDAHRADGRQCRDRAGRGIRRAPLDGIPLVLRPACHEPMHPSHGWQDAPHSQVACGLPYR